MQNDDDDNDNNNNNNKDNNVSIPSVSGDNVISAKVQSVVQLQHLLWLGNNPILDRQALLQLLQMNSVYGSLGTDAAQSRLRFVSLLTHQSAFLESKPPVTSVYSYSFPSCRVDIACFQISFTNFYETTRRPPAGLVPVAQLAVEYVLRNPPVLHAADMAKPAQPSLNEQGERGSYSRLCQKIIVWDIQVFNAWTEWYELLKITSAQMVALN